MSAAVHRTWRLLPSERVLWQGGPTPGIPRDLRFIIAPAFVFAVAIITALFAGLLHASGIHAVRPMAITTCYLLLTATAMRLLPRYSLDPCAYMVTDRQVIWKRGQQRRTMDRFAITYARIHWHRSVAGVGHLELVRAVPFGPLARKQRIVLHDIEAPDIVFALIRGSEPAEFAGYADVPLTDRLDRGERVLWGASPAGWRLGPAEAITAVAGTLVLGAAVLYWDRTFAVLLGLERVGLPVLSWTWLMLFSAILIAGTIIVASGVALLWQGLWGARAAGSRTEYVLTDSRLLIRRGRTELSVDRRRIVDVADLPSTAGSRNLHLILDAPDARALADSGALGLWSPPRATVPPVLYEVTDLELVRALLLSRSSQPGELAA